jgi:hypothetical protein
VRRLLAATLLLYCAPVLVIHGQDEDPFESPLSIEEMRDKQVVVQTTAGSFVIDLLPEAAPNHVGLIMQQVVDGEFDGTSFHGMVARGSSRAVTRSRKILRVEMNMAPGDWDWWPRSPATSNIPPAQCPQWVCPAI